MSTEDDTVEKVQNKFGGTWVKYSNGTTLVGDDGTNFITNDTQKGSGGSSTVTLTTNNLPSHSHVIPALSVSSWSGTHTHSLVANGNDFTVPSGKGTGYSFPINSGSSAGAHWFVSSYGISSATITVSGQKTTASNTTTYTNCSAKSINIQNP